MRGMPQIKNPMRQVLPGWGPGRGAQMVPDETGAPLKERGWMDGVTPEPGHASRVTLFRFGAPGLMQLCLWHAFNPNLTLTSTLPLACVLGCGTHAALPMLCMQESRKEIEKQ